MARPRSERPTAASALTHLSAMLIVSVVLGVLVAGIVVPFVGVAGLTTNAVAEGIEELPQELETDALPQRTRIVDGNGKVIATLFDQNRVNVSLDQMSQSMRQAIVAIEDARFYQHGALDLQGTLRALVSNQAAGGVVQGGSSITQQLVKLTLVQQATTPEEVAAAQETSFSRKIQELRYAIALEKKYSKDWILERYLNTAYFGDSAYGVQAAAQNYFSRNARKLTVKQSALLAGLVQNPVRLDPTEDKDRAKQRRNVVLQRMADLQVITQEKADKLKNQGLGLKPKNTQNGCLTSEVPFFCQYVVNWLKKDRALGKTKKDRERMIQTGGLTIRTTVDLDYQRVANESVRSRVFATDNAVGGLAMVEPGTGDVKAIAQSRPMGSKKRAGETFINYAVPKELGESNGWQGGSTFKVFTLAAALEQGLPLTTTFNAQSPMTFDLSDYDNCPGEPDFGGGTFSVPNSVGTGVRNMYDGTRLSANTYFMQLLQETGVCEPFSLAKSMGLYLNNPRGQGGTKNGYGPGAERLPNFTLGTASVSPLEMAEAYATFGARGMHCASRPVTEIRDLAGNTVKEYAPDCERVMEESSADAVNDVLRGVTSGGGFASAQALDQPSAGKTGTTNSAQSVWFAGYTPNMAAAAFIGGENDAGQPESLRGKTVGGRFLAGSGSGDAAPIWGDAMKFADDELEDIPFVYPSTVEGAGVTSAPRPKPQNNGNRGGRGNNGNGRGGR